VAARIETFDANAKAKIINVFYGFASKVFLENVARNKNREVQLDPALQIERTQAVLPDEEEKTTYNCLESCLGKLPSDENRLIVAYYGKEKHAGIAVRRDLAESMQMKIGTLHTRVCRIRSALKACIEECMQK
jgi:DNA-directed RNA polymerase specialized sigma24 family protein